jgi:hypothetical protein
MANVLLDVIWARLLDVPCWDVSFVPAEGQLGPWSIKGQSNTPVPEVRYAHDEVSLRKRISSGSLKCSDCCYVAIHVGVTPF